MKKMSVIGLAAAFMLQAALLSWLVIDRALLLAHGTEIRLNVVPVDPRDLLRGDYVTLSYAVSRLWTNELDIAETFAEDDAIYVSLRQDGKDWKAVAAHRRRPADGLVLKGRVTRVTNCGDRCRIYAVDYNLEKFFVSEGQGRDIERLTNGHVEVDVAVAANGRAALKRLLVDGAVRYADILF
jgi:uncharacterized membrane-anchored protein